MAEKQPVLTFDQWVKKYKPIKNTIAKGAPYDGYMFETYGAELEHIKSLKLPNGHFWTIVTEEGDWIVTGARWVNRLGYFVTKKPWKVDDEVAVDGN